MFKNQSSRDSLEMDKPENHGNLKMNEYTNKNRK